MANGSSFLLIFTYTILTKAAGLQDKAIRLSGGETENEGAIQVKINGKWGYLCDISGPYPKQHKGDLVCKELSYKASFKVFDPRGILRKRTMGYWKTAISCNSADVNLLQCSNTGWAYESECSEDTGFYNIQCLGDVRYDPKMGGIIYIYNNLKDKYQTMCLGDLTNETARVFCKQVGFQTGIVRPDRFIRAPDTTMIERRYWCAGEESALSECRSDTDTAGCADNTAVAVAICRVRISYIGKVLPLKESLDYGVVNVFDEKTAFKRLCADSFDEHAAKVVCRERGYGDEGRRLPFTAYRHDRKTKIWNKTFACTGSEDRLRDCKSYAVSSCLRHGDVAAVACSKATNITDEGKIRITKLSKRIEVFQHGIWGSICANNWNDDAAKVVCGQTSFAKAISIHVLSAMPMWIFDVDCAGDEANLQSCKITKDDANFECNSMKQAGAYCDNNFKVLNYSLVNGGRNYGNVQLTMNGITGYVTSTGHESAEEIAYAACISLGFNDGEVYHMPEVNSTYWWGVSIKRLGRYVFDMDYPGLTQLQVENKQPSLSNGKQSYLSVFCFGKVKLVGGTSHNDGYVEEYMYGLYYTFCADDFTKREGDAVCRQLGHAGADKVANSSSVDLNLVYPPIGFQQLKCPEGAKSTGECTSIFQPYDSGDGCMSGRASVTCGGGDSGSVGVGKRVQGSVTMVMMSFSLSIFLLSTRGFHRV